MGNDNPLLERVNFLLRKDNELADKREGVKHGVRCAQRCDTTRGMLQVVAPALCHAQTLTLLNRRDQGQQNYTDRKDIMKFKCRFVSLSIGYNGCDLDEQVHE